MRTLAACFGLLVAGAIAACAAAGSAPAGSPDAGASGGGGAGAPIDAGADADADPPIDIDASNDGPPIDPDAACAAVTEETVTKPLPVDIIWMVDNSASMAPAVAEVQAGINDFAAQIGASNLDYKVILLSLRGATSPIVVAGKTRYPVCVPQPLGDGACGNGPRFFHSSLDVLSTQTLEQFLGTLGQTSGYMQGEEKGGEPWAQALRPEATKTIVVVTDDNARLAANDFETYPGGTNPFNALVLPPGILDPSWNGLFDGYLFSGIYGWGSDNDPGAKCVYPDQTSPPSSGWTYSTLVGKTGGVRAKICDGHAAWQPFFDAVAQAVLETSKLSCTLDMPTPEAGTLDPTKVNVQILVDQIAVPLFKVAGPGDCGPDGGWYYDDDQSPSQVILCPASCEDAQAAVGPGKPGKIEVLFGCETILK